jgi:hypothetical protein
MVIEVSMSFAATALFAAFAFGRDFGYPLGPWTR